MSSERQGTSQRGGKEDLVPYIRGKVRQPWGTTETHEKRGCTPLVVSIAEYGDGRPREEKDPLIAHSVGILRFIGTAFPDFAVAPSLIDEIRKQLT